jgi:ADP-ribose pyrophosphatase YjhB (NUDIX family)
LASSHVDPKIAKSIGSISGHKKLLFGLFGQKNFRQRFYVAHYEICWLGLAGSAMSRSVKIAPLMDPAINFCCTCGSATTLRVPDGDSLPRHVCTICGVIHYRNPRLVVGTLPVWEDRVLLCRRAIEPRHGKWTLPAGFMENGESVAAGAARETAEEANARIDLGEMFTMISLPHIDQVHVFYRATLLDTDFSPGVETLETALFRETEIPWDEIAFRTVSQTLRHYFADRITGAFRLHAGELLPP